MLEYKDKGQNDYPVDEADLDCAHSWVVLHIHYLLQLAIAFLDLRSRLLDVEVDSV